MKKISFWLFLLLFICVSSYFFASEYKSFIEQKIYLDQAQEEKQKKLSLFSFSQIQEIPWTQIYFTPDKKYLDILEKELQGAQKRVYINVYMLTEKRIRNALLVAKKRWVDIKIILEKNVYNSAGINNATFDILSQAGIDIQRSSNDVYDLNHAKYILIDNRVIISTGNLTASTFSKNRDIFVHFSDKSIVKTIESIFLNDFTSKYIPIYHHSLVISPWDSRQKILYILKNASSSLQIYMPYMDDKEIADVIFYQLQKGVKVQIISWKNDTDDNFFQKVIKMGWNITFSKKTIHAKSILIDDAYLFIGSENFSSSSLDTNKEVWVLLRGDILVKKWKHIFESDL